MISSSLVDALLAKTPSGARPFAELSVRAGAWIVMPRSNGIPRDGLAIYNPQRFRGKLAKALIQRGLWRPPTVYLRDGDLSEFEGVLAQSIGRKKISCAFYFRSPGLFSKTIALIMDEDGRAVAFAKLASTSEGKLALAREGDVLDRLASVPGMKDHIPRVMARTAWREFPALVLSVGPSHPVPKGFGTAHSEFLKQLDVATACPGFLRNSLMWRTVTERFQANADRLEPRWRDRYAWAMREAERRLGGETIPLSLAHRDFVPWNIHGDGNGSLFVFDWELAQDQCTPAWDFFHFHLAGQSARSTRIGRRSLRELLKQAERHGFEHGEVLLLAYLADIGLFLHDRLLQSPAVQPNRFLNVVQDAIDILRTAPTPRSSVSSIAVSGAGQSPEPPAATTSSVGA